MALRIGFFGLVADALELVRDCFRATENGLYWDLSVEAPSMVLLPRQCYRLDYA